MAMTSYAQGKVQNAMFHGDALGPPGTWYVALYSTAQNNAEGGTECADGSYARQSITFAAWVSGVTASNVQVLFPALAGSFTCAAVGLVDNSATGAGHCWEYLNLTTPQSFTAGQQPRISSGNLSTSMA